MCQGRFVFSVRSLCPVLNQVGTADSLGPTLTTRKLLSEEKCYNYQRSDDLTTPYVELGGDIECIAIIGTGGCVVKINMM